MKLAFSSNAYMKFSIEETIGRIAAIGYSGLATFKPPKRVSLAAA